jgi:hypothetical protein
MHSYVDKKIYSCKKWVLQIDRKVMDAKWSRALVLLLRKEERGLLKGLVLEVLEERLWYNVT